MTAGPVITQRCSGHCCKRFPLPYPLDEIQRRRNPDGCRVGEAHLEDGEVIADMLIDLGETTTYPDGTVAYLYTCRHLQPSGDCGAYSTRPRMCSEYPYGTVCTVDGCTLIPIDGLVRHRDDDQ